MRMLVVQTKWYEHARQYSQWPRSKNKKQIPFPFGLIFESSVQAKLITKKKKKRKHANCLRNFSTVWIYLDHLDSQLVKA